MSTGAQNGLQCASDIVRAMVAEYGVRESMGLMSDERSRRPVFLPESFSSGKLYSEAQAAQIDDEVARFGDQAHQRVRKILSERRTVFDALVQLLPRQESGQGEELREMLSPATPTLAA